MELLHHLDNNMAGVLMTEDLQARSTFDQMMQSALASSFLTDELLAISALHMSTLPQQLPRKTEHLCRATQLQSRALAAFNIADAAGVSSLDKCLFYSVLGLHSLFETLSFSDHFSGFLDQFVRFIRLQQKCRYYTQQSTHLLRESPLGLLYGALNDAGAVVGRNPSGSDFDKLSARLETGNLEPPALAACRGAVASLQWVSDMDRQLPGRTVHVVLAWPMLIPQPFIDLIEQRRPEALVILAHYAALLCSCSGFWVLGDTGASLARLITRHLGAYWEDWLPASPFIEGVDEPDTDLDTDLAEYHQVES
jgi:hypothetical protein